MRIIRSPIHSSKSRLVSLIVLASYPAMIHSLLHRHLHHRFCLFFFQPFFILHRAQPDETQEAGCRGRGWLAGRVVIVVETMRCINKECLEVASTKRKKSMTRFRKTSLDIEFPRNGLD